MVAAYSGDVATGNCDGQGGRTLAIHKRTPLDSRIAMPSLSRRKFLAAASAAGALAGLELTTRTARAADEPAIAFGLVTYMWGADWDLPTLLANCKKTNVLGVE